VVNAIATADPIVFPVVRSTAYKINGNKEGYWPSIDYLSIDEEEERDIIDKTFYLDLFQSPHQDPERFILKSNVIDFYKGQIDSVVNVLTEHPGYSVEIQGHTDSKGSDE
jgi:hypothetical protein